MADALEDCFGLLLYRQAVRLLRFGGSELSRNTLNSAVRVGREVQFIVNLLRDHLLEFPLIHGDETHVQALKEIAKSAQSKSYMWVQMTPGSRVQGTGPPNRLFGSATRPRAARRPHKACTPE
jgi:transposase